MDKVICVGKNYLDHAKELGDAVPARPVIFLKPPSTIVQAHTAGETLEVALTKGRGSVHHELEIVLRIQRDGDRVFFDAVTLGLDMTLRDVQSQLKKDGHPWEMGKVFEASAILGPWMPLTSFENYLQEEFSLKIDGQVRQRGRGIDMRLGPDACLASVGEWLPLKSGDALFSGTPAGVGPVEAGQEAELLWNDRPLFRVRWR
jgi:2-keto-4-pentenoate hydratase/2-oxohepta-3-ene-1,7-dioic acid hydratase in catechol pathway